MENLQSNKESQEIIKLLNSLEKRLSVLEEKLSQFKIMYKRPGSGDYETLSQTLDYLHKKVLES